MPTEYTNEEKIDEVLSRTQQDLWKPNIIGQTARESLVDYSNPRRKEIAVSPGGDIQAAIDILKPGGRLVVISFQGMEDKIVKEIFKENVNAVPFPIPGELTQILPPCNSIIDLHI